MPVTTNYISTECLPKLMCAQCSKVLSQFPIYCYSGGSSCGRCPYPENGVRNEAYEALVQKLKFPCCYNGHGCLENLFPQDVEQHESLCSFRKYNCPMNLTPSCEWKGFSKDLLDHFSQKHRMFLLNEYSFEVDFVNSHNENYLLPYGEGLYLVNRLTDSKKHTFFCTVSCIGGDIDSGTFSYKIILENGNKSCSHEIVNKMNNTTRIEKDVLGSILNDPISIVAKLEIFKEAEVCETDTEEEYVDNSINYKLLQELECLVCLEYMIPPIHQCVTGHSICLKCKESVIECPTCKKEFHNTQNFALAQVIQHIKYPCKYDRCKFTAKPKDIKQHEATCIYSPYKCPLRDYLGCNQEIQFDEMYDHITQNHIENLLQMDVVEIPFCFDEDDPETIIEDCFITKYGTKLFKLPFLFKDDSFYFTAQLIGPSEESSRYRFEIDILDNVGGIHRAYMTNSCGPMTDRGTAFDNDKVLVSFTCQQIKRLIGDQLCFRVRIFNN